MRALVILFLASSLSGFATFGQETQGQAGKIVEQARQLVGSRQLQQANELLSDFVRHNPGNEDALVELGRVQIQQGLNDDALKSFEEILTRKPDSAAAREGEVKAAVAVALADRQAGANDSALLTLIRARKLVPDSPELLLDFGVQAESMRIYEDADEALTKGHAIAPDDLKILYALARVEVDEQKTPQAESNLRAYLAALPDDATAHYGMGHLLHIELKDEDAKVELERSIALQPRQTSSYYELGEIALEQNDDVAAAADYQKVLGLAPNHGGALTGMGILAFRAKDYASAEKYLKSAILYASDYSRAHHYYSLVLARLGRQDESAREAEMAQTLNAQQSKMSRGNFLTIIK
jgi:tetratricopeptide (TPR) repeat protein